MTEAPSSSQRAQGNKRLIVISLDDTHTTIASDDFNKLAQMMKEELQNISEWMRINKLSTNPKRAEVMFIGHPRRINKIETLAPLKLNSTEIKRIRKTKSLGIIVDENLSWKEHFKSLKGKVTGGLSALKNLKTFFRILSYVKFTMRLLKITSGMEMLSGAACPIRSCKRFSDCRTGPSPSLKMLD